jgi:hypothetical protein
MVASDSPDLETISGAVFSLCNAASMSHATESLVQSQVQYSGWTRASQLVIGIICMAMIANLQYGWTLFVNPIVDTYHFDKKALQYAFTIFVLCET